MTIYTRRTKAGKARYRVQVKDERGKYYPTKTLPTIREAQLYERKLNERKDKSEHAISALKRNLEVCSYLDEWLEYRSGAVSSVWHGKIARSIQIHILPVIGSVKLSELCSPHIGKVMTIMKKKGLFPQTRRHVYNHLNQAFSDAVDYFGYLQKNPVQKQDRPKIYKTERNYLIPKNVFKLLDYCKNHYMGPAVWISALCGLRISEVQSLIWKAVDFEKNQILVCKAYSAEMKKDNPHPKQKDWLIVPIPKMLVEYLKPRRTFPLGYVVPAFMGGRLDASKFRKKLKGLCTEAEVNYVTPHELRHSCSEVWIRQGATLEDIRRLFGHKSAETTKRYIHKTDDRLIKLANEIDWKTST